MTRPTIEERFARLINPVGPHHIWTGNVHHGKPRMRNNGKLDHPVRAIMGITDRAVRIIKLCHAPLCVNPEHYRFHRTFDRKLARMGEFPNTPLWQLVIAILDDEIPEGPPDLVKEAKWLARRCK
ncbi:hypothetical protein ACUN0C_19105 [Faunimonas sp. B44]|uniref:hypothetical protein n=1 Tax=Faunimonas sp. B44 TaxID=3461493 RepID=UPI004044CBD6